jgi:phospholipid transport system substrate-binding protein
MVFCSIAASRFGGVRPGKRKARPVWRTLMIRYFTSALAGFGLLLATLSPAMAAGPARAVSDPAAQQIREFYAVLVDTMKQGTSLGIEGRYKKLKPAVEAAFNLPAMTQFAVGPAWTKMSEDQHKALIAAFERMTIANYAKNFDSYDGQKFVVLPDTITRAEDKLVQSELRPNKGEPVKFNYRMRVDGGKDWKVIDVLLAGFTSQLALRRSEFAHTVDTEGAAGLVKKINQVADNAMKG